MAKDAALRIAHATFPSFRPIPSSANISQSQQRRRRRRWRRRPWADQNDISQREKEIIAETWKQQGDKKATQQEAAEAAKFLSGVQAKLREQAQIPRRAHAEPRDCPEENEEFNSFVKDMNAAAEAMGPAVAKNCSSRSGRTRCPANRKRFRTCCAPRRRSARFKWRSAAGGGGGGGAAEQGATSRACSIWSWTRKRISTRPRRPPASASQQEKGNRRSAAKTGSAGAPPAGAGAPAAQ